MATRHPLDAEGTEDDSNENSSPLEDNAHLIECPVSSGLVFSSLDTHFSPIVCLQQFVFHIFFPFTVPIAWYKYGMKHAHIQGYHFNSVPSYIFSFLPFLCWASALGCLLVEPDVLSAEQLVLPFGVFILQRMMIAVKYASLSPDEYR